MTDQLPRQDFVEITITIRVPTGVTPIVSVDTAKPNPAPAEPESSDLYNVTSKLVGTFYRTPNENEKPFAEVGDTVEKGQTVCIVEAMKVLNEITYDGDKPMKVLSFPVENAAVVEACVPLVVLEPIPEE